jgi:hypothetical protein
MNLDRYIQGIRKGRDINFLEREAMCDPFLADALEGYDQVKDEHPVRIDAIKRQIIQQTRTKNNLFFFWGIAMVILGIIGTGIYFLWNELPFSADDYFTGIPEIKTNTTVIAPQPVAIPDSIQTADSLQVANYFFNQQDTFLLIKLSPFVTEISTDSLSGPLTIPQTTEEEVKPKPEIQPETIAGIPKPAVGYKAYENYLKRSMIRPADDDCEDAKGKVVLTFSINGNGRPYDINVTKSLCPSADAEAIRLLKEGPGWISGDKDAQVEVRF